MAKEKVSKSTDLDKLLNKAYKACQNTLDPKKGESFVVTKVENGMFGACVFGEPDSVALNVIQFLSTQPKVFISFLSQLKDVPKFNNAYLKVIMESDPEIILSSLREMFDVLAIPADLPKEQKLSALEELKAIINNDTADNTKSQDEEKD